MAKLPRFTSAFLLLVALAFLIGTTNAGGPGSLTPSQCDGACGHRCSATHHPKACLLYCNMCCKKCLCVPSGTYGHRDECPCYRDWQTKRGTPKCP